MSERLDTYCGLYCGSCGVFLANKKGLLEAKSKEWKMETEDLYCKGCKSDTVAIFCRTCHFKTCAENKGIEYCFQCHEFPCQELLDFKDDERPHHSIVLHNLDLIKEQGIDKWLKEQELRWSCPECKEKYSWYESNCSNCGNPVRSCLEDEKDLMK